jgi:hypothetical protein
MILTTKRLFASQQLKTKGGNEFVDLYFFRFVLFDHTLSKLRDVHSSVCSFSLSPTQSLGRERENSDHQIIFVVTIESLHESLFECFLPTSIPCPFSLIIIRLLYIFFLHV